MMSFRSIFFVIIAALVFSACSNEEGEGGIATIKGKVLMVNLDENLDSINSYYAVDENVYINYGLSNEVDENTNTGIGGSYEFRFLFPGDYNVFTIGDDTVSGDIDVAYNTIVTVGKNDDIVECEDLVTYNILDFDDGSSSIKGRIISANYFENSVVLKDTSLAQDDEVYLIYNGHVGYDDRVRTSYNGEFIFNNLIKGDYQVFVYSDDTNQGTEHNTIIKEVTIDEENKVYDLGDINVIRFVK